MFSVLSYEQIKGWIELSKLGKALAAVTIGVQDLERRK